MSIKEWFIEGIVKSIVEKRWNLRSRLAFWGARKETSAYFRRYENMETKKWYQSKTIIVNGLTVIAGALSFLASPDAKIDAQTAGTIGSILAVVNVLLRLVTGSSIQGGSK